jgi:nitrate reductase delta subunit
MEARERELKLLALLLQYPDAAFREALPELAEAARGLPDAAGREALQAGVEALAALPPLELAARYTAAFDLSPSTTLDMTHHLWGDSEQRAAVLARLERAYRGAGYARANGELPDFLPLMLEFLAVCPQAPDREFVWSCLEGLKTLGPRLAQEAPVYAALLARVEALRPPSATAQPLEEGGRHEPRG